MAQAPLPRTPFNRTFQVGNGFWAAGNMVSGGWGKAVGGWAIRSRGRKMVQGGWKMGSGGCKMAQGGWNIGWGGCSVNLEGWIILSGDWEMAPAAANWTREAGL